jgi:hypothetical protein
VATHLSVNFPRRTVQQDWQNIPGLLEALERHATIEGVALWDVRFDPWKPSPLVGPEEEAANAAAFRAVETDVERMFGSVLPSHPSLRVVKFVTNDYRGSLPYTLLQLFVSRWRSEVKQQRRGAGDEAGISTRRPPETAPTERRKKQPLGLEVRGYPLVDPAIQEMATALREGALSSLAVCKCHIDAAQFRLLLESAVSAPNGELTCLELNELGFSRSNFLKIDKDTFANGLIERMAVPILGLESGRWTDAAYESLTRQMRTNTAVASLRIRDTGRSKRLVGWILELLTTYNFSLQVVFPIRQGAQDQVNDLLRRNGRVRAVHEHLERLHYVLEERALWPRAISQVARFPTLVYRFLRRGDVDGLADQMGSRSRKKRQWSPSTATCD